ncbi:hypothetical protein [Neptunomonas antarctica]|uniref:Uncharacterized protein n=1 Tax=Neptunomonas antarctica TaxID=619304 RepID=A0A1N7LPZ1_9GAMM|nr:hypothetical protein [Neptunomonas antarctica]SIS75916.1 hypothetical protein SAMN05421760_104234 [Neptunomonas antarctica]
MLRFSQRLQAPDTSEDLIPGSTFSQGHAFSLLEPESDVSSIVTEAELRLLAEWFVPDLISILNKPEEYADKYAADYTRFHERAGCAIEALLGSIQPDLLTVRFGVGGVFADLNVPFQLNEKVLVRIWRHERPVSHWIRKEHEELKEIAVLGRPYALASAALVVQKMSCMRRLDAIKNQCYDAYLRQIYLRAFNFYGISPLSYEELGVKGVDPWMQVASSKVLIPAACTGRQLQLFARRQFRDFKIPFEVFSILKNLPLQLPVSQRLNVTNWTDFLQNELSASWMRGESGQWIEKSLDAISESESSASVNAQGYMLD